jgi:hypothetical protein
VGFEPTIPVFEQAKIVLALDRAATVMGIEIAALHYSRIKLNESDKKTQDFH